MKEQCRTAERFLPEVLTAPTKIIILPVTRVTARTTVYMLFSLLFVQNYIAELGEELYYSIIKYSSVSFVLELFFKYKLPEGGLLNEHV